MVAIYEQEEANNHKGMPSLVVLSRETLVRIKIDGWWVGIKLRL